MDLSDKGDWNIQGIVQLDRSNLSNDEKYGQYKGYKP